MAALDLLCLLLASSAFLPDWSDMLAAAFTASSRSLCQTMSIVTYTHNKICPAEGDVQKELSQSVSNSTFK